MQYVAKKFMRNDINFARITRLHLDVKMRKKKKKSIHHGRLIWCQARFLSLHSSENWVSFFFTHIHPSFTSRMWQCFFKDNFLSKIYKLAFAHHWKSFTWNAIPEIPHRTHRLYSYKWRRLYDMKVKGANRHRWRDHVKL